MTTGEDRLRRLMLAGVAPKLVSAPKIHSAESALLAIMQADVEPMRAADRQRNVGSPPRDDYSCGRRGASGASWDTWLRQKPTVEQVRALIASGGGAAEGYERWGNHFRLVRHQMETA